MADPVRVHRLSPFPNVEVGAVIGTINPDDLARAILAVLATDAGQRAIREGVDARLRELAARLEANFYAPNSKTIWAEMQSMLNEPSAAPREPAQDEDAPLPAERLKALLEHRDAFIVANGLWERYVASALDCPKPAQDEPARKDSLRAAGFAEGVEAAAEIADGFLVRGPDIAAAIRSMPLPAAPDPLLPGLRAARDAADELRLQGMRLALVEISSGPGDEVERDKHAAAKLRAEIARRGGA